MNLPHSPRQLSDVRQLLRLRQLREQQALAAMRRCEQDLQQAQQKRDERLAQVAQLRQRCEALAQATVGEHAAGLGRLSGYVAAMNADLDDLLERAEDALLGDEYDCEAAQEALAEARQAWLKASGRRETAAGLAADARTARHHHLERLAEREDDARPPPHLNPHPHGGPG
jgi:DNA-binding transcriptional MerR regulator